MSQSLVIRGELNKYGHLVGLISDSKTLSKNEWDFRILSLTITPLSQDIDETLEFSCSFNSSNCFNYQSERVLDKNTPVCVKHVKVSKNDTKTIKMDSDFPWLRIEHVSDKVHISILKAGTDTHLPEKSVYVIAHLAVKRIKWRIKAFDTTCYVIACFCTYCTETQEATIPRGSLCAQTIKPTLVRIFESQQKQCWNQCKVIMIKFWTRHPDHIVRDYHFGFPILFLLTQRFV